MLQIGLQQQRWGRALGLRPGLLVPERRGAPLGKKRIDWNWGVGSSSGGRLQCTRRRNRSGEAVAMDRAGVEPTDDMGGSKPLVDTSSGGGQGEPRLKRWSSFNSTLNKVSKWAVLVLTTGALLWRHDEHAVWFAVGSVINGGVSKGLKYLINENRPLTADGVKEDPGMPSSHAQGFAFVGTYACLALILLQGAKIWTAFSALSILLVMAYWSWLRVLEGLHSVPQVLVGSALGSSTAAIWLWVWKAGAEAAVESSASLKFLLYVSLVVVGILFYFSSFKDWQLGQV